MSKTFEPSEATPSGDFMDVPTIISNLDQVPSPTTHSKQQQIEAKGPFIKAVPDSLNTTSS